MTGVNAEDLKPGDLLRTSTGALVQGITVKE
jgi:hypothetical protein